MTNYIYKKLAESIANEKVSKKDALKILSLLSISELRTLLRELKLAEEKNILEATLADELDPALKKKLVDKFPDSKLTINVDRKIGAGIKVRKFDMIYDFTVKSKLENIVNKLGEEI